MDEVLVTAVQESIDAQSYPPTHQYDVRTLAPRGPLADRLKLILGLCPDFFCGNHWLDVGASKGFFSLRAARLSGHVMAIEPYGPALKAWDLIKPPNVTILQKSFGELVVDELGTFDMIWIGNGHHYLHLEDPPVGGVGGWVYRLASMALDRVIVEGPVGPGASGFADWEWGTVPIENLWLQCAAKYGLRLVASVQSPSYTPGRKIWYLRRKTR